MIQEAADATAVQGANDMVAVGCSEVFLAQNLKIPEDVSVAGFGDTMLSEHFRVPLTTVSQPKHRLGMAAMDSMLQIMRGHRPEPKRLPAQLVVRASSGIPPATPALKRLKMLNV
jgi:LacI family transcriptional regulator